MKSKVNTSKPIFLLFLCIAIWFSSSGVHGAELKYLGLKSGVFSPYGPKDFTHTWSLSGRLNTGDAERLRQQMTVHAPKGTFCEVEKPAVIYLNSEGGNFSEGLKLSKLFRTFGIGTAVKKRSQCLSACAVAFLGGTRKLCLDNDQQIYRRLAPGAKLGFHAPRLVVPELEYQKKVVEKSYETAVKQIATLVDEARRTSIAHSLLIAMLEAGTRNFYFIDTVGKAGRWGIDVAVNYPQKLTPEQIATACGNAHAWRNDLFTPNEDFQTVRYSKNYVDPAAGLLRRAFVEGEGMYSVTCFLESGTWPNGRSRYWIKFHTASVVSVQKFYTKRRLEAADVSLTPIYFYPQNTQLSDLAR